MAHAQDAAPAAGPEPEAESAADDAIVVTGSRIARTGFEEAVPVTTVQGEEFFETGQTSIGDVLNELPQLRSTISQSNSTRNLGTAGLNLLDLRGLGTQRTLVLQNGRRHVSADILNNAASVDTNQIPTDLIERVDIVTGGSSAVYGSDAIAGVVNFILKDDFEGVQLRGQGGISKYGDAGAYFLSAVAGTNFADDRGNIAVNFEYAHNEDWYAPGRPNLRNQNGYVTVDSDPASAVNGSDGNPDRVYFEDIRSAVYSNGGTIEDFNTGPYYTPYIFQADGSLVRQTGRRVGNTASGSFIGGNGDNFRSGQEMGLYPKFDRYSVNLIGHFEVSDAFIPFIEAKYVRSDSLGSASGPAFMGRGGTFSSPREIFYTDNPFLTNQARGVIRAAYGDFYDATGNDTPDGIPDADQYGFYLNKNITDIGVRQEAATRETYRIVTGARGTFNEDWSYELALNYGEFNEDTTILGNLNVQRFLMAIDAVRNPANGNIVCRATIDPTARQIYEQAANTAYAQAQLANDVAQCVPINLFGSGNVTQAARDYVVQDTVSKGKITQFVVGGSVAGDSSQLFELPGGPVGFAAGFEYRKETNYQSVDPMVQAGITFYNALPEFDPPSFEVKELFGELRVPVLKDVPFFQELTLNAAGRVADYKGSTGTVYSYNAGIEWSPVRDIRFRANYARAVRAPNLTELYAPLGQNFGFINDPCSLDYIGTGSSTRQANCRAAGVPANFNFQYQQTLEFRSGGNEDLKEETSDSLVFGAVFEPSFIPGLVISADYYDIQVDDVITAPSAQQIVNACYDAPTLDNQFCSLFQRAGAGGGPRGEIQGRILEGTLQQVLLNYAKLKVRGIDVQASYQRNIEGVGDLSTRVIWTHVFQNDQYLFPDDPNRANQLLMELGDPEDAFNWNLNLKTGPWTLGYQMRYIGKMILNGAQYEDFFSKQGRPPQNADWADRAFYPSVVYHDIRAAIDVNEKFNFYIGVDNVTNRVPPLGQTGIGAGSGIYSNIGRFFYAGATAKF
ncbi:TonB-dependent receptor domain-containing protein [Sphingomonas sp. LaA6.9]|uniref:TonB-dependent receptor domain-containing protein n=1 Tax=Sphingomonas sp. LaA6.9 TaxID=2919914 RepID=UPI001F4F2F78|nr:TonB-dependent receptor [Sphingomonas sp. LaA6.9]MCJ8157864.1 TonB-dependent receptor [Sphingomonas sp. LaA6.9]